MERARQIHTRNRGSIKKFIDVVKLVNNKLTLFLWKIRSENGITQMIGPKAKYLRKAKKSTLSLVGTWSST